MFTAIHLPPTKHNHLWMDNAEKFEYFIRIVLARVHDFDTIRRHQAFCLPFVSAAFP